MQGISMIMYQEVPRLSPAGITKFMADNWPDLPPVTDVKEKDLNISFNIGDAFAVLGIMPAPIPWADLEGPCATSFLWPKSAEQLKPHQAHIIIVVKAELPPVAMYTLLTQVTAAVLAASPSALGVYWGSATLVVPRDVFIECAVNVMPHGLPLWIWIDLRTGKNGDRTIYGFTSGMEALGHMEFETQKCTESIGKLRERFVALGQYVLENGPVIKDGDTVGEDARERILVVYSDSSFGHSGKVMRLVYEKMKRKWGLQSLFKN